MFIGQMMKIYTFKLIVEVIKLIIMINNIKLGVKLTLKMNNQMI